MYGIFVVHLSHFAANKALFRSPTEAPRSCAPYFISRADARFQSLSRRRKGTSHVRRREKQNAVRSVFASHRDYGSVPPLLVLVLLRGGRRHLSFLCRRCELRSPARLVLRRQRKRGIFYTLDLGNLGRKETDGRTERRGKSAN